MAASEFLSRIVLQAVLPHGGGPQAAKKRRKGQRRCV
jgi:hypothetical protein